MDFQFNVYIMYPWYFLTLNINWQKKALQSHFSEENQKLLKYWIVSNIIAPPVLLEVLGIIFSEYGIYALIGIFICTQLVNLSYYNFGKFVFFLTIGLNVLSLAIMGKTSIFYALLSLHLTPDLSAQHLRDLFSHYFNLWYSR